MKDSADLGKKCAKKKGNVIITITWTNRKMKIPYSLNRIRNDFFYSHLSMNLKTQEKMSTPLNFIFESKSFVGVSGLQFKSQNVIFYETF